jgi:predicted acetyltransferase
MTNCRLIAPNVDYEASHRSFIEEFVARGETIVPWVGAWKFAAFYNYVASLEPASRGVGVPPGFVPHSTFWLVDSQDEIVGISNLRHALTDGLMKRGGHIGYGVRPSARGRGYATELLRATLGEARALGLRRVRVTCDKDNVASAKTIVRNGGVLEEEEFMPEHGHVVSRYWIDL